MSKKLINQFQNANDYYIHYNKFHIGDKTKIPGDKTKIPFEYQQARENANINLVEQYKQLFNKTIKNHEGATLETLGEILELDEKKAENVIKVLQQQMIAKIIPQKTRSLLDQLGTISDSKGLSLKNLNKVAQWSNGSKDENAKDAVNEMLESIKQAVELITSSNGALGALLSHLKNTSDNVVTLGKNLEQALNNYDINNEKKVINNTALNNVVKRLKSFAETLQNKKFTTSKKKITGKGLLTLLRNTLISTDIAQVITFSAINATTQKLAEKVQQVGTKQVRLSSSLYKDTFYNPYVEYKSDIKNEIKNEYITRTRKTDILLPNLRVYIKNEETGRRDHYVTLDVGISSKFYKDQRFKDIDNTYVGVIKSGSGGSLAKAIDTCWGSPVQKYYVFNYLSHNYGEFPEQIGNIHDIILRRMLLRLFAAAGGATQAQGQENSDFAHFIFINGKLISVWSLVQYVINSEILFTRSTSRSLQKSQQGITLSIGGKSGKNSKGEENESLKSGRKEIINAANTWFGGEKPSALQGWRRSRNVNVKFHYSTIEAHIHLKKLLDGLGKMNL